MKHNKEKEEREKASQKFFSHGKRALYDIMPRAGMTGDSRNKDHELDSIEGDSEKVIMAVSEKVRSVPRHHRRFRVILLIVLAVAIALGAYAFFVLPEASIEIVLQQKPWEFHDKILASLANSKIPLQVFTETKNIQLAFPASGKKQVSRRAHGTLKICNAFNSDSQPLVATTRFLTPGNILFRLDGSVTVPGATIVSGKILPKCIEAEVSADKPGAEYNIGPIERWSIPGLKDSPKYAEFYGVSEKAMTGGVVGETRVPLAQDVAKAKEAARAKIKEIIATAFKVRLPSELSIIEDKKGTSFTFLKEVALDETDASGNFQYFIEARDERLALRESDVKAMLAEKAQGELGSEFSLASSRLELQLDEKTRDKQGALTGVSVAVDFAGGFVDKFTEEDVKNQAAGKTEAELRDFIPTHKNFKAHITLWPFWVKHVPQNKDKIKVTINVEPIELTAPKGQTP